jgi:Ala-tRNA(Pro) deacylase
MISPTLTRYIEQHHAHYRAIHHARTGSSGQSAEAAHVPGDQLAKAVILEDAAGTLMAVIPSDYHLDLSELRRKLGRSLDFVEESDLLTLFPDCDLGAVPPIGPAFGLPTIWDTRLGDETTVYCEAGDHETLLKLSGQAFHELMAPAERGRFSHHA